MLVSAVEPLKLMVEFEFVNVPPLLITLPAMPVFTLQVNVALALIVIALKVVGSPLTVVVPPAQVRVLPL